ncbi:histidine kinase [Natronococcus pandeyae]|uniref:Histidine kinase n=1 Tax=Natronococcus pandeyae TaxID=2055836 RepID=A0A8J8Q6X1_9EURY|nr:DICT sensory domain-containing protein [Natronococcus pandeyae]TYL39733.1 histidine kinase [Natronococcus pandeyae]
MTIDSLRDALESVERERKRLEVYTAEPAVAAELERQFTTRNVTVDHRQAEAFDDGFVAIRDPDNGFRGTLGLDQFDAILSPETHLPWAVESTDVDTRELFDFLENTLFASYDRRQMLAASREIEERAWRIGEGTLYAGFEREAALVDQLEVYDRLASHEMLTAIAFVDDTWGRSATDLTVVPDSDEIGAFWFVVFDGAGSDLQKCALVAEERRAGQYYGFWTYDPEFVDELVDYLERTYDPQNA